MNTTADPNGARAASVSVIVPVRNGGNDLVECLGALARSATPPLEVIVVDDGSTDGSGERARAQGARVLRHETSGGPAAARNRGAALARGEFLLFVDADVAVQPAALARAVAALEGPPRADAVMGSYDDAPSDAGFVSQYKNLFHHWVHQHGNEDATTWWTGCGAIRRDVFLAIGGFNEGYTRPSIEDIELGARLRVAGYRLRLEKQMLATHRKRWRLGNLLYTDLFLRGVPWIALMLRDRHSPRDLNLSPSSKLATLFAAAFVLAMLVLPLVGHAAAVLPAAVLLAWSVAIAPIARRCPAALALGVAGLATLASGIAIGDPFALLPLGMLAGLIASHADLYAFFADKRGAAFALATLPMHLLFQLCCGASVPLGIISRRLDRRRAFRAAEGPAVRALPPLDASERQRRTGA